MAGRIYFHRVVLSTVAVMALLHSNDARAQVRQRGQRLPSIEVNLEVLNSLRYGAPVANGPYAGGMGNGYPADPYSDPAAPAPVPPPQQVEPYQNKPPASDSGWYGGGNSAPSPTPTPTPTPVPSAPPVQPSAPPAYNPYGGANGWYQDGGPPPEWAQRQMEYARRQMGLQQEQGEISTYQPGGMPDELPSSAASTSTPAKSYPTPKAKPPQDDVAKAAEAMDQQLSGNTTTTPPAQPEPSVVAPPAPLPEMPAMPTAPTSVPAPTPVPTPAPAIPTPAAPDIPPPPAITPPDSLVKDATGNVPKLPEAPADAMDWLKDNAPKATDDLPIPSVPSAPMIPPSIPPEEKKEETKPEIPTPVPSAPSSPEMPKMLEIPAMPAMPEFPSLDEKNAPPPVVPPAAPETKAETKPETKNEEAELPPLEVLPPIAAPKPEVQKEEPKETPKLPDIAAPDLPSAPPAPLPSIPSAIEDTPMMPPALPEATAPEEPEQKGGLFPGLTHTFKKLFSAKKEEPKEEKKIEEVAPPVIPEVEPNVPSVDLSAPRPAPIVQPPVEVEDAAPRPLIRETEEKAEKKPELPKLPEAPKPPAKKADRSKGASASEAKNKDKARGTRGLLEQKKDLPKPLAAPEPQKLPELPSLPPIGGELPPLAPPAPPSAIVKKEETKPAKPLELPKIEAPKLELAKPEIPKMEPPKPEAEKRPMRHEVIMQPLKKEGEKAPSVLKMPEMPKMPDLPPMPAMPDFPKDAPALKAPEPEKTNTSKAEEKTPAPIAPPPLLPPDFEIVEKNNQPVAKVKEGKADAGEKEMVLTPPEPQKADTKIAAKPSSNALQVVYGRDDTSIPESMKSSLKGIADKAKTDKKRMVITAYASGKKEEAKAANMISLSRALALRAFLIESGLPQDKIIVKAKGIDNPGGASDRAEITLD